MLVPSYTLTLPPGIYKDGLINMGDTVPVIIRSGRLNVNTTMRIVGLSFVIGDDGQEDVEVDGRSLRSTNSPTCLPNNNVDVNALARR